MSNLESSLELGRCPHCKVDKPNLHESWRTQTTDHAHQNRRFWCVYNCRRCGGLVTAFSTTERGFVKETYPANADLEASIPTRAREYLMQANNSVHAPAGCVLLAASAVDAMLKERGYAEGSLYQRIDKAAEDHLITKDMAKWAHVVRLEANDQRHADQSSAMPDEAEARKCLDFSVALAQFMFVLPARVQSGLATATES